jgi:hypothetical protein
VTLDQDRWNELYAQGRRIEVAQTGDDDLGPLKLLPGRWENVKGGQDTEGRGWNMIALPFPTAPGSPANFRLLLNRYNEKLSFSLVDKAVPNRGIVQDAKGDTDQLLVTLDFEQAIVQSDAADFPESGLAGGTDLAIHHEPGLFLFMTNFADGALDVARLSTIPHGDSVLALGTSDESEDPTALRVPRVDGLPIGAGTDVENSPYLAPYKHFRDAPFLGLFDPTQPHALLNAPFPGTVKRFTRLDFDSTHPQGGIHNIPFVVREANAAELRSIFWIVEVEDGGRTRHFLQYLQVVLLDFFPRFDGLPGPIRWPHVSINRMEKVAEPEEYVSTSILP